MFSCEFLNFFWNWLFFLTSPSKCFSKYHRIHMFLTVLVRELQIYKDVLYSKYVFSFQLKVFPIMEQWPSYGKTMMMVTVWWFHCDDNLIMMVPMFEKHRQKGAIFSKVAGHWWGTLLKKARLFFNIHTGFSINWKLVKSQNHQRRKLLLFQCQSNEKS